MLASRVATRIEAAGGRDLGRRHPRPLHAPSGVVCLVGLLLSISGCAGAPARDEAARPGESPPPRYALIPRPRHVAERSGSFRLTGRTRILVVTDADTVQPSRADARGPAAMAVAERWAARVRAASGLPLPVVRAAAATASAAVADSGPPAGAVRGDIVLRIDQGAAGGDAEGYRLSVHPDGTVLAAPAPAGLFYGLQTLAQLLPPAVARAGASTDVRPVGRAGASADVGPVAGAGTTTAAADWRVPAVDIEDAPRFRYRGMHLDVGRHVFPVEFIKRYLDLMAGYKLNTFHWHLTEDQGWRLQIEGHPRLTGIGACRAETQVGRDSDPYVGDGERYCGYYTQEQAREIVAYARDRFITVVPEIEMPGHALAALAAYPELACTPGPFEVGTRWGVYEDIYCPSERTFAFLEDVLTQVMAVFPSRFIHIGGDEAPKDRWRGSDLAQAVMVREGLDSEDELQSWFIGRIGRFLAEHGRRLIGWDEILEGGLAPGAAVMSWRGVQGGIAAARAGHDVVMTPTSHLYFDYYQGDAAQEPLAIGGYTPLEKVYGFEPVPDGLGPAEAAHVLGAQANVWTEYMATPERVEYMVFPRLLALSEVVWSPESARDYDDFVRRLGPHFRRLAARGVRYRVPDVLGLERDRLTLDDHVTITLRSPMPGAEIRYTLDGSTPTRRSPRYTQPLRPRLADDAVTVAARLFLADGRQGDVRRARFARTTLRHADDVDPERLAPGLRWSYYEGEFRSVEELTAAEPASTGVVAAIGLVGVEREERFGVRLTGWLRVPEDGIYTFRLSSDDGAVLRIGDRTVVDHDGLHGMTAKDGQIALAAGLHRIEVLYFQAGGGRGLRLEAAPDGREPAPIPASRLVRLRRPRAPAGRRPPAVTWVP